MWAGERDPEVSARRFRDEGTLLTFPQTTCLPSGALRVTCLHYQRVGVGERRLVVVSGLQVEAGVKGERYAEFGVVWSLSGDLRTRVGA
jgi:hypothetical protein